jgi:DNA-binding response OmpR family regulator
MNEKTILIIDTDIETIEKIESILESEGFHVFIASSKESSLATAKKINPSLIFVNISFSGISGLEICKAVHGTELLKNVPIIITTPHGATIEQRYTDIYGIVDFLKKPFSPEELISKTIDILELKSTGIQPAKEEGFLEPFEIKPLEAVHPVETELELPPGEEKMPDIQEEVPQIVISDATEKAPDVQEIVEEKREQIVVEETSKVVSESVSVSQGEDISTETGKPKREGSRKKILVLLILLLVTGIAAVGIMQYTDWFKPAKVPSSVPAKPAVSVQPQIVKTEPVQEQQVPKQSVEKRKSETSPVPEVKPGKAIFHVQIGVFKNISNAEALAKRYKESGYDAFTYKSTVKDKGTMYRVLIGKFEKQKEAAQLAGEIRAKEKINAVLFHE